MSFFTSLHYARNCFYTYITIYLYTLYILINTYLYNIQFIVIGKKKNEDINKDCLRSLLFGVIYFLSNNRVMSFYV